MISLYLYLYKCGFISNLIHYYEFILFHYLIITSLIYFINNIYDDLINYLKDEFNKDWHYEQKTDMQTGLTNIDNVIRSLGPLTTKIKQQVEFNKKERARIAKKLKEQAEEIRQNKIKHIRWLEEYYKNPPTKEQEKEIVKELIRDMRKEYKKWLD
uniref:Uncharacterized protein n=1 Tax=Derbesia sp. WEST4838 TaxID=1847751 RepID=A0A1C9JBE8_9CHLO|nr:hypothetical protein [Derbesia sp. WEST4838]AOP19168.1 hypothetical protein [Derbesia sp. WEST4838]